MTSNTALSPISEDVVGKLPVSKSKSASFRSSPLETEGEDPFAKYTLSPDEISSSYLRRRPKDAPKEGEGRVKSVPQAPQTKEEEDPFAKYIIPESEIPSTTFRPANRKQPAQQQEAHLEDSLIGSLLSPIAKHTGFDKAKILPSNAFTRLFMRSAATLAGYPRMLEDLLTASGNFIHGKGFKTGLESGGKRHHLFPSAAELQSESPEFFNEHATGTLGFIEDWGQSALEMAAFGGFKSIGMALAGATAEKALSTTAKAFGASESTQGLAGIAGAIGGGMVYSALKSPINAQKFMGSLFDKSEKQAASLPKIPGYVVKVFENDMANATKSFKPSKYEKDLFKEIQKMAKHVRSPKDLVHLRNQANRIYPKIENTNGVAVHGKVVKSIDNAIELYAKYANATFEKIPKTAIKAAKETLKPNEFYLHPPTKPPRIRKVVPHPKENAAISKWHSEYKDFNEVAKVFHRTRRSQDKMIQYLNKVPKSKTFNTLLAGLHFFPKSTAVATAVTAAGLGVAKGGLAGNMVLRRVLSNPIWAAYYEKAVQKMLSDNAAGAYKILKHLEKELDHEEK